MTIAADSVTLGTDTSGNYVGFVNSAGTGLSIIGSAGEGVGFTVVSNATSNNTASTIVSRDGSGNFTAGTITANLTGAASLVGIGTTTTTAFLTGVLLNTATGSTQLFTGSGITIGDNRITATTFAGTATSALTSGSAGIAGSSTQAGKLSVARTIQFASGDVTGSFNFDGSANVSNIALTIEANSVALGTDTAGDYVGFVNTSGTGLSIIGAAGEGVGFTVVSNATSNNTVSTIVSRDASGNFTAGTITANLTGAASLVGIGTTIGTAYLAAVLLNTATGGTQIYTGSGITIGNNRITATTFQGNHLGTWSGSAVTALYGGTGLDTVSKLNVLAGASTGNSWVAIGSSYLPTAYVGEFAPPFLTAFGATQAGQLWWDSTYGVLKVYYADTNTNQWVDALPVLGSNGGSAVKRSYLLSFGAGFTPSLGADSVSIMIPYAPDNTSLNYYIKRLDFRAETTSSGAGVSFYIERNTTQSPTTAWTIANTIHSAAGTSFRAAAGIYITSYTNSGSGASFVSSAGVAASVMSGDYLRLNFHTLNSAATLAVSMIIEQQ